MPQNFKIIKASAGSGKTYQLVKEYLMLILSHADKFRHILAITFTNKAAAEMKERVLKSLTLIANSDDTSNQQNPLLLDLQQSLLNVNVTANAPKAILSILHDYSDFAVSTIDSFSHRLIRSFAYDMKLASDFTVELDFDTVIKDAVDNLIARVGNDVDITDFMLSYIQNETENETGMSFEKPILDVGNILKNEKIRTEIAAKQLNKLTISDFVNLIEDIKKIKAKYKSSIETVAHNAVTLITQNGLDAGSFSQGLKGVGGFFYKVLKSDVEDIKFGKYTVDAMNGTANWYSKSASPSVKNAIENIKEDLQKYYEDICKNYKNFINLQVVGKNIYPFALLNEISKEIELIKADRNILPIAEFNTMISNIVAKSDAPFIYEKIDAKYANYMIDEFQDTSVLQWQNIIPLIDNSLSLGNANLIVGDAKQAIYRWRNGEVKQFVSLPKIYAGIGDPKVIAQREQNFNDNYCLTQLGYNYRSMPQVVDFNNKLYDYVYNYCGGLIADSCKIYEAASQQCKTEGEGFVELDFYNKKEEVQTYTDFNLKRTLEVVKELHNEYNYDYADIAVLCRAKSKAQLIADYLVQNDIPVTSPDSLMLVSSKKVLFIITLMKIVTGKNNDIDFFFAASFVAEYFNDNNEHLLTVKGGRPADIFAGLCKLYNCDFNYEKLLILSGYEFCENVVSLFKLDSNDAYLQRLLNVFYENPALTIQDFPEWFAEKKDKLCVAADNSSDSVQVMTIHKSKGLEFPIVICPFTDYNTALNSKKEFLLVDNLDKNSILKSCMVQLGKSLHESDYNKYYEDEMVDRNLDVINLLYVSTTRAVEQLYIFTENKSDSKTTSTAFEISDLLGNFVLYTNDGNSKIESVVTFGEKTVKNKKSLASANAAVETCELLNTACFDWRNKLNIAVSSDNFVRDYRADNDGFMSDQILWGNKLHLALSLLEKPADAKSIIARLSKKITLNEAEIDKINITVKYILENTDVYNLMFDNDKVLIERDMCDDDGSMFRADRVNVKGDKYQIIDFKTGEQRSEHATQVKKYCNLIKKITNAAVEGYVLYCDNECVKIDAVCLLY
ncbi:MAG: UvrD-helicase domain-containing protein [Bacteroidales bacterium]|nr:UvrD-helicase domain-containing protein [Bacteroidales bacterium]MDD3914588.1 UvrD-helicase domain-containing protein [Bacteroidales bacterium]MDD4634467.1 UvrD-helicase domain-containing protein [Bacteroidales bacterium]